MKSTTIYKILFLIPLISLASCVKLEQEWYDQVVPETFFKSEKDVRAALYRPFTHARWYVGEDRWNLQEYSADQFAITTKGRHWYNGGENERYHYHRWTQDDGWIWGTWRGTLMGIALALDAKQDLEKVDYESLALTQQDKDDHLNQLNTLIAEGIDTVNVSALKITAVSAPIPLVNMWCPQTRKLIAAMQGDASALNDVTALERGRCAIDRTQQEADFWVQSSDFFKLRTLSATYQIPTRLIPGSRSASFTLAGRNLFTITDYNGIDPEVADQRDGQFARREYYNLPPMRSFEASLRVGF